MQWYAHIIRPTICIDLVHAFLMQVLMNACWGRIDAVRTATIHHPVTHAVATPDTFSTAMDLPVMVGNMPCIYLQESTNSPNCIKKNL